MFSTINVLVKYILNDSCNVLSLLRVVWVSQSQLRLELAISLAPENQNEQSFQ